MRVKIVGGEGLHRSEVRAVKKMETEFPNQWYAYAGIVINDDQGSMEIDTLIITEDRILLVELKEWNGKITSRNGVWYQNGQYRGKSPYDIKRQHAQRIKAFLKKKIEHKIGYFINVETHVVLCGSAGTENLAPGEKRYVHMLDDFLKISDKKAYNKIVQDSKFDFIFEKQNRDRPCSKPVLREIQNVFNGKHVTAKNLVVGAFIAESTPWFTHRKDVYKEIKASHEESPVKQALIRRWDFSQLGTENALREIWAKIVLRESRVSIFAEENSSTLPEYMLRSSKHLSEDEVSEDTCELYDLKRTYERFDSFLVKADEWDKEKRVDVVRSLITPFAELHAIGIAHRDIDPHNLWYASDQKSIIMSGFAASYFKEKGTISDLRKLLQSSPIKLPEDELSDTGAVLDPFKLDVYMLALVAHKVCFPDVLINHEDGIPEWRPVDEPVFNSSLDQWFEKAFSWEPEDRFVNADDMLSEFNSLTKETVDVSDTGQEVFDDLMSGSFFKENLNTMQLMFNHPPKAGESLEDKLGKIHYLSEGPESVLNIKFWSNIHISKDALGENRRVLNFLNRILDFKKSYLPIPKIVDFGLMSSGGLFLVSEFVEGETWSEYLTNNDLDKDAKLNLAISLVEAIQKFHLLPAYHGDLHPENIIVSSADDNPEITVIDSLDYGSGSEPHNTEYGPDNPAQTDGTGRDLYSVYKIVEELFAGEVPPPVLNELNASIYSEEAHPFSLDPLLKSLNESLKEADSVLVEEVEPILVVADSRGFPVVQSTLESDDGSYYFSFRWDRSRDSDIINCFFTGASDTLRVDLDVLKKEVVLVRLNSGISLSSLVSASRFAIATIDRPIAVIKGRLGQDHDEELIDLIFGIKAVSDAISQKVYEGYQVETPPVQVKTDAQAEGSEITPVNPKSIWNALLEAEQEHLQSVTLESQIESENDWLSFEYSSTNKGGFEFDSDDKVIVFNKESGADIGQLVLDHTGVKHLTITPSNYRASKELKKGLVVSFESIRNKSSRDAREKALKRVIQSSSVIPNLQDYFNTQEPGVSEDMLELPSNEVLRKMYDTKKAEFNDKQIEAFQKLISQGPLGVLQGPPGTGKTTFISQFIHYLFERCDVKNILLVGQSHTSVDNVAIKAKELFAKKNVDLPTIRIGREEMIDESLLPEHTSALQRQIRHKFHREYELRIDALSARLPIPKPLVRELSKLHRTFNSLLSQRAHFEQLVSREQNTPNAEKYDLYLSSQKTVEKNVNDIASSLFDGEFVFSFVGDIDPWLDLVDFISKKHGFYNPREIKRLTELFELSQEWLDILKTGEANYDKFMVQTKQLVCGTLVGVGQSKIEIEVAKFDWVIVDEAGRAQASELMIPIQSGKRVLLVGDHKQLPPLYDTQHLSYVASKLGVSQDVVKETDFERAFKATGGVTLDTQYRMIKPIGDLVSACFYSSDNVEIQTGRGDSPDWYAELPPPFNKGVSWIDSSNEDGVKGETNTGKGRLINKREVETLMSLLKSLNTVETIDNLEQSTSSESPYPIGVITMYRAQKEEIESEISKAEWLGKLRGLIKIDTVDSYQGQENKIIILSLVRDNLESIQGFLGDQPRINVAISRAQERLVVIGASRMWKKENNDSALGSVFEFISSKIEQQDARYQLVSSDSLLEGVLNV